LASLLTFQITILNPDPFRAAFESYLERSIPEEPESLYDPVRTCIKSGGKRLRPILTALCAGVEERDLSWLGSAAAVELLHTFTLVHDDIMDNAATRRGIPTVHVQYGRDAAILSGDVIVALAVKALAESGSQAIQQKLEEFAKGFQAVCDGQALDKEYEVRSSLSQKEYIAMIELKTSRMFELAAVLGALDGPIHDLEAIRLFARNIGLAFQIQDDILDLTGDEKFGKTIGGDVLEGKRTILFVLAMEKYNACGESDRILLDRLRDRKASEDNIRPIRALFERMGVLNEARTIAERYTDDAEAHLLNVRSGAQRDNLRAFGQWLLGRAI